MANWKRHIDISKEFKTCDGTKEDIQELAKTIASRLLNLDKFKSLCIENEKNDLIQEFLVLSQDNDTNVDSFDSLLHELYNWADNDHTCWIQTF